MLIKNRNLFRITRFLIFNLPGLFKTIAKLRKPRRRLLIIKPDVIGDYILFRNFIKILKDSEEFGDYEIDLVANKICKEIVLTFDAKLLKNCRFIRSESNDLYESPWGVFKLACSLFTRNYKIVLQPTFSRTFIADGMAGFAAGKQTIGFLGDNERIDPRYKIKTDKFYTTKLLLPKEINFEFERSKFFFEQLLGHEIALKQPFIEIEKSETPEGIIICPGAGVSKRSWEKEKFLDIAKLILQYTKQEIILVGGPSDKAAGEFLEKELPKDSVNNLIGKTSLPQLIELVANAVLIIGNETSTIHIAVASQTKAVCILGGGHFGRFAPYPDDMQHSPVCIYEKMDCYFCNWNCIFKTSEKDPYPCISAVTVEKVWQAVSSVIV